MHDELHQLIEDLTDDQAAALLHFATYLQARQHDMAVTFWRDQAIPDWDDDPSPFLDLAPALMR
jgi:hypothetical protein